MILGDSIITPTKRIVHFGLDERLIEAVYEDDELRRIVPQSDEMLGDITATLRGHEEAWEFGEEVPEWDDSDHSEARQYAAVARDILINAGCIFAEHDLYEEVIYFSGRPEALKRSFDFCVKAAGSAQAVLRIVGVAPSVPSPQMSCQSGERALKR